jgi:2'-5' RNA ligase
MSANIRAFIAIELPDHIITAIRRVQESLKAHKFKVRWVKPENIHLTLKFLGDINPEDIARIDLAISQTVQGIAPISLSAGGSGVFPGIRRPRVVWVGISGEINQLKILQQTLDEQLEQIGFPREKRAFKGHLTLGRIKGPIDPYRLNTALNTVNTFSTQPFMVDRLYLFRSDLEPTGSIYTRLLSATLAS